jgi:hypothetical protein
VVGQGSSEAGGLLFHGVGGWPALSQGGQRLSDGELAGRLEVEQGLAGGGGLLVVAVDLVPANRGDDDEDSDVEEHRQPRAVFGVRCCA